MKVPSAIRKLRAWWPAALALAAVWAALAWHARRREPRGYVVERMTPATTASASGNPADAEFTDQNWSFQGSIGSCNYYHSAVRKPDGKVKCKSWTAPTGLNESNDDGLKSKAVRYYCTNSTSKKMGAKDCIEKLWGRVWTEKHAGTTAE